MAVSFCINKSIADDSGFVFDEGVVGESGITPALVGRALLSRVAVAVRIIEID